MNPGRVTVPGDDRSVALDLVPPPKVRSSSGHLEKDQLPRKVFKGALLRSERRSSRSRNRPSQSNPFPQTLRQCGTGVFPRLGQRFCWPGRVGWQLPCRGAWPRP